MSSTETANKLKLALLKIPKQRMMQAKLKAIPPKMITLQINNETKKVSNQQTILESSFKDFKKKVPFNCRAGICGACEANVARNGATDPNAKYEMTKICYTPVEDGMRVLTLDQAMQNFRQGTADE